MAVNQVMELGLVGFETTLPTESRVYSGVTIEEKSSTGESSNGTIRKDIVSSKKIYTINYSTISETNKELIEGIYYLQLTNATTLNFIISKEDTSTQSFTVYMDPPSFGTLVPNDTFYYSGTTLTLREAVVT